METVLGPTALLAVGGLRARGGCTAAKTPGPRSTRKMVFKTGFFIQGSHYISDVTNGNSGRGGGVSVPRSHSGTEADRGPTAFCH